MAETTAAARRAEIMARLDSLTERDREIAREIGAKLAEGKAVPAKLRTERASVREEIEDLTAALPHVERQMQAEKAAEEAARKQAATSAKRAVEEEAAGVGASIRTLWVPLAAELAKVPDLDTRFRAAQRAVTGRGDAPVSEPMGLPLPILRDLEDIGRRLGAAR